MNKSGDRRWLDIGVKRARSSEMIEGFKRGSGQPTRLVCADLFVSVPRYTVHYGRSPHVSVVFITISIKFVYILLLPSFSSIGKCK